MITKDGQSILPHQNWRGQFSRGTYANGAASDCAPGQTSGCQRVAWPGWRTTAWHFEVKEPAISVWFGGLVDDMRDASGQMYKRNRYYDPATGQFTQQDPIGIAGGLNSYGFAEGDPVTYSDPYGLMADTSFTGADNGAVARAAWHQMRSEAEAAVESGDEFKAAAGSLTLSMMRMAEGSPIMYEINVADQGTQWRAFFQGHEDCPDATLCRISLDHTQQTNQSITVRLGHELGGVLLGRRFDMGHATGSMIGENAARLMNGCKWRGGHNPFDFPATPC